MRRIALLPSKDMDRRDYELIKKLDLVASQTQAGFRQIDLGNAPSSPGQPLNDHGLLGGLGDDDHLQYFLLAGRVDGQSGYGSPADTSALNVWSSAGAFTSESTKSAGSSWVVSIDTSASVGDIVLLHLVTPPFANGLNTTTSNHSSITDTQGNTWTKIKERTYSDAFGNGCAQSVWRSTLTTALTAASDTLTVTYSGSIGAMAISSHRFTTSGAGTFVVAGTAELGEESFVGPEPSALNLSGLTPGVQYLFFRATGKGQAGSTVIGSYFATSGYTAFTHTGSITAGGTGNVGSCGEYGIGALTASFTDPQLGSAGGHFSSIMLAVAVVPSPDGFLRLASQNAYLAAKIELIDSDIFAYADTFNFLDAGGATVLSYIDGDDGAFIGPVEPTSLVVVDEDFFIIGSSDPTKRVRVEVDGLTANTDRTLTVPDVDGTIVVHTGGGATTPQLDHADLSGLTTGDPHTQYLLLAGRSGGQRIGAGTHASASQASDLAIEGQLLIDHPNANTSFVASRALDVRYNPLANGTCINVALTFTNSVTSGTVTGIDLVALGTMSAGGSSTLRGFRFITTGNAGTGATVLTSQGGLFQVSMSTAGGTINRSLGLQVISLGDTNATTHSNGVQALELQVNPRAATTTLRWLSLQQGSGTASGTVSELYLIDCGSTPHINQVTVGDWTAIRISDAPTNPVGVIRGLKIGAIKSHHVGQLRLGDTTTPTHSLEIAAGSATRAPLLLTSGALLTAPAAGVLEHYLDGFYVTPSTTVTRQQVATDLNVVCADGEVVTSDDDLVLV